MLLYQRQPLLLILSFLLTLLAIMKKSGTADLPLHTGIVPKWLYERMTKLGLAISEAIIYHYGKSALLSRLSDPFWFQSFGSVLGMDWHSSGITTSVMGCLKAGFQSRSDELGIYICGGKGQHSRNTAQELIRVGYKTGVDGDKLARYSRLAAKIDNTAVQDGFQLYLHSFIATNEGEWAVVQQGMQQHGSMARRYHWHSKDVKDFVSEPHSAVCGTNQGHILNLVSQLADSSRSGIMEIAQEKPDNILKEARYLKMPMHHDVKAKDIDLKRLGSILWLAQEVQPKDFSELLLLEGLGPRTLQSLAFVSEVIHGTPTRFEDPARFSFAHGGKDGHPFPVLTKVYDESICVLQHAIEMAKVNQSDKLTAIKTLSNIARNAERGFSPQPDQFNTLLEHERSNSWKYEGRTVSGLAKKSKDNQLSLFD